MTNCENDSFRCKFNHGLYAAAQSGSMACCRARRRALVPVFMPVLRVRFVHGYALADTCFFLFGAHIGCAVRHVTGRNLGQRCHVTKLPVMSVHAVVDRELKRNVSVVRRLIDTMQERRPLEVTNGRFVEAKFVKADLAGRPL